MRIAYHGVAGSNGHLAARTLYPDERLIAVPEVHGVVRAVLRGNADFAVVPVENSIIGPIAEGAALAASTGVTVVNEIDYPIRHCLLALQGATASLIRSVESHPAALAQCARYIVAHGFSARHALSTAGAARAISTDRNFTCAAIAGEEAAELYGLAVLDRDIADCADNRTRFVVLGRAAGGV